MTIESLYGNACARLGFSQGCYDPVAPVHLRERDEAHAEIVGMVGRLDAENQKLRDDYEDAMGEPG